MKWFYKLKSTYRIIIAVAAWLPLVILAGIMGGTADEMSTPVTIVGVILLALGIVFTVFAVKASSKESAERKRIINEKAAADKAIADAEMTKKVAESNAKESARIAAENADNKRKESLTRKQSKLSNEKLENIKTDIEFPYTVEVVGVIYENRQELLECSNVGDWVTIEHMPSIEFPNAVQIDSVSLNEQLGFVPKDEAKEFVEVLGENFILDGRIAKLFDGNEGNLRCKVIIYGIQDICEE